jgi:hypothetical protein
MHRLFKLALLSLLVLALPLQGVAAAVTLCGPIHQRMAGGPGATAVSAVHDHQSHHHGTITTSGFVVAANDAPASQSTPDSPLDTPSCSACATCCSGAATAGLGRAPGTVFTAAICVYPHDASFSGFIPEGPEDPPRSILV